MPPLHLLLQLPPKPPPALPVTKHFCTAHLHKRCETGCGTASAATSQLPPVRRWIAVLTISKLQALVDQLLQRHRAASQAAAMDRQRANGGLGEYYSEGDTRGRPGCAPATPPRGDIGRVDGMPQRPAGRRIRSWSRAGSMTVSPRTARAGVRLARAVCMAST